MLNSELKPIGQITDPEKKSLYKLLSQYFAETSMQQFSKDLAEKDYIIMLRDSNRLLRGFSTVALIDFTMNSKPKRAIFSGDTIIHHDFWGTQSLPLSWCQLAGQLKHHAPDIPLYWFLIVKGYRTYRYLSVFAKQFFPNWKQSTPEYFQSMMDKLASEKFGSAYLPDKGIVHFPKSLGHLQQDWAAIPAHLKDKPDVAFFLKSNPEYFKGDELVCWTELCESNLKSYALKAFRLGNINQSIAV